MNRSTPADGSAALSSRSTRAGARAVVRAVSVALAVAVAGFAVGRVFASLPAGTALALAALQGGLALVLTLVFEREPTPGTESLPNTAASDPDLLQALNLAGRAAGVQLWDWDLVENRLKVDRSVLETFDADEFEAETDPLAFVTRCIHTDDLMHYREHLIRALKGLAPLSIDYRVVHKDGSVHPVQLRGQIFWAPTEDSEPRRAIRMVCITIDMTEKTANAERISAQTEQQRQLIERLRLTTDAAGIGVWEWDLKTGQLSADSNMATIFPGSDVSDIHSATDLIEKILHPEDRGLFVEAMTAAIQRQDNEPMQIRFRCMRAGGTGLVHHVELHGRVLRDAKSGAKRFLGVSWNVTAKVEAQTVIDQQTEAQRLLLERLNLATEVAGLDVWDWNLSTDRLRADAHMTNAYGGTQFEIASGWQLISQLVHPQDVDDYLEIVNRAIQTGKSFSYRYRMVLQDGKKRHVQVQARVFRDAQGKAVRILGVNIDKTDEVTHLEELRRQADGERALRDRLNLATKNAGISIWDKDLLSGAFSTDGQFWSLLGIEKPDPMHRVQDSIHVDVRDAEMARLMEAIVDPARNEVLSIRHRTTNPRAEAQYVQTHMRVFRDTDGKPVRLLGVTWDVTREVEYAAELERKAAQERALVERLNVTTKAAGISPWEYDLKSETFSWMGVRQVHYGFDDAPIEEYMERLRAIVFPEDRHLLVASAAEAIASNTDNYTYQFRVRGIDGKVHHMRNICKLARNERGRFRYVVGVTLDVTKEIEANQLLQERAEENRALIERLSIATESANIGSWEIDLQAERFIWVDNPVRTLGMTAADFGSLDNFAMRIVPEDRTLLPDAIRAGGADASGRMALRYRAIAPDGSIVYVQTFGRVIVDPAGKPLRALGVSWDVTKEVLAEERLRQKAELERTLVDRLNVATQAAGISPWEFDLPTNQFSWLGARVSSLGLDDEPLDSYLAALGSVTLPEDRNILMDAAAEALRKGVDVYSYRFRANCLDGKIHHLKNYVRIVRSAHNTPYRLVGVTWDVTEEVEAAQLLQSQAEEKRQLVERLGIATNSAGISSWEIDLANSSFLWIENPIKSVRFESDHELNVSLDKFTPRILPEDRPEMAKAIGDAIAVESDRINYRYRAVGNAGTVVHIQNYARFFVDAAGKPVRVLGVSWDVTSEVLAAEQLQQQTERLVDAERRLERASISSSEGHWEADLTARTLWYSSSFRTLLGYSEGELDSSISALEGLVHDEDRSEYQRALREHLADDAPYDVETRLLTAQGEYRWFRMRGMAERDAQGVPTVMAGSIHDIHQQKAVEDALRLAQLRFERAINGTQDGLWELDVATGNTWCSPRLAMLLGYPAHALEGTNYLISHIHPEDQAKVQEATVAHYRHNVPFDLEVRLKNSTGDYRWFRARASAERDRDDRALRLSGSLQDVTEAREAREELVRATEAAEAASRAKSAFLANVSHEIRTPMNGIIGMTGLMIDTRLDRTQREYADTIRTSADSLLTVINDILDFSKIEAGKLDLENIELDLRANVEEVGTMLAFQAASKGLELIVNVQPEVPERVLGDPQRLRQCLINLVGNAIKFTKQGEIVVDVCVVGQHDGRTLTHFEVRDTGLGIAEPTLKTLFQPFVQADSSTTRHFGGTGLGLSIVRRLVEMMGGKVGVVSEVGKGSNFFFTLALESVITSSSSTENEAERRDGKILIVDDNATNRRVLGSQLTHSGYRITAAGGGAEAVHLLQAAANAGEPFDIVVTDFLMPDMDGAMLGERIGKMPELTSTRLIMLTSLDRQGDMPRFAALGFAAYLTKPVRARELLDCVQRVLAGDARQWQAESRPMITRNTLSEARTTQRLSGRVLVVEDNVVNQKVAARFLERLGCSVRIAEHGEDGVTACLEERFDVVLMDLQMPVMDGLTATRRIRELESGRRTPIIALTANAMRGDQERCEAAGMDGFLTKPIEVERLNDILARFGMARAAAQPESASEAALAAVIGAAPEPQPIIAPPIDLARVNEITGDDPEFAQELLMTFVASGETELKEISAAIQDADRDALARAAHKLKGACANVYAHELRTICQSLEMLATSATVADLEMYNAQLQREFARTRDFLNSVLPARTQVAS